jgi:hypothetical protein
MLQVLQGLIVSNSAAEGGAGAPESHAKHSALYIDCSFHDSS